MFKKNVFPGLRQIVENRKYVSFIQYTPFDRRASFLGGRVCFGEDRNTLFCKGILFTQVTLCKKILKTEIMQ